MDYRGNSASEFGEGSLELVHQRDHFMYFRLVHCVIRIICILFSFSWTYDLAQCMLRPRNSILYGKRLKYCFFGLSLISLCCLTMLIYICLYILHQFDSDFLPQKSQHNKHPKTMHPEERDYEVVSFNLHIWPPGASIGLFCLRCPTNSSCPIRYEFRRNQSFHLICVQFQ